MLRFLILLLYNLAYLPVLFFMAPAAVRKMKSRGGKWSDLRQRFGFFDEEVRGHLALMHSSGHVWWMHAVSVGEVGVAAKLIRELARRDGTLGIVLSTTTPTGFAEARKLAAELPGRVLPIYNPLDLWFTVRRCLNRIKPERLVLVEAEVWPNLVYAARSRGIEVALVNARLSPRSECRYGQVLPLVRTVFSMLERVFVQESEDILRWEKLGVAPEQIICTGSIKYDDAGQSERFDQVTEFENILKKMGWSSGDPVLLAASTHAGEEAAIAQVFIHLRSAIFRLRLIIVPRHAERAAGVATQLQEAGLTVARRSMLDVSHPDVLLVDATGELRAWQQLASVVVVGKSFLSKGGQNPAEALTAGKPVFFGPHMENFATLVRQLLAARGAVQVADFMELERSLAEVLQNPAEATRLASSGAAVVRAHEGATARTASALLS
ncbi:MAG: 3-deoxy-D-manno-octulosonic acid transferase [Verrucomicrobia bacterium]|nr:3-deoxy-D-manno-octulosonic acid transferase [Verrucomicrobiota bacterium]